VIVVNGQPRDLPDGTALADLVADLVGDGSGRGVAVAVNGDVVPRASWAATRLAAGDRVEILTATQGG